MMCEHAYRPKVCSVCGQDWMRFNHAIWCGGFGYPHGKPVPLIGPLVLGCPSRGTANER